MSWTALIAAPSVPVWSGPVREFRLLDLPASVPQPRVGGEAWELRKQRRKAAAWVPWTLLTAANEAQMRAHRDHWPLIAVNAGSPL